MLAYHHICGYVDSKHQHIVTHPFGNGDHIVNLIVGPIFNRKSFKTRQNSVILDAPLNIILTFGTVIQLENLLRFLFTFQLKISGPKISSSSWPFFFFFSSSIIEMIYFRYSFSYILLNIHFLLFVCTLSNVITY